MGDPAVQPVLQPLVSDRSLRRDAKIFRPPAHMQSVTCFVQLNAVTQNAIELRRRGKMRK